MLPVDSKLNILAAPNAKVNNASFTTNVLDTQGFRYAKIYFMIGAIDATMTTLKLQESDGKSSATALDGNAVDIVGTRIGTDNSDAYPAATSTLPTSSNTNVIVAFEVDLRPRKRYLQLVATSGNGAAGVYGVAWAELSRGEQTPTTAADKNLLEVMRV